ncbi:MAG: hypothetical protein R2764_07980 [Bacteroidales bacterium]
MRIYSILCCFILLFSNNTFGQKWDTIYGNPGISESFRDLKEFYDNGYLISGGHKNPQGNWLIKTSINKNILWEKIITWENTTVYSGYMDQDSNGNIYIASTINSEINGFWPMAIKLDSCGEKLWCRVFQDYDNYNYGWFNDVLALDNGDMLAVGELDSEEEIEKIFLWYIDSDGDLKWRQGYASQNNYPHIRETNCDGIRKYGSNYIIHGHCYYPYPSDTTHFYQRPLFIMLDSLFNEQWIIPFGVSDSLIGAALESFQLNDSVYMGVGMLRLEGTTEHSLIMYFNEDGQELGYKEIPNDSIGLNISQNYMNDIERINDSLFITSTTFALNNEIAFWGELIIDTGAIIYKQEFRPIQTHGWTSMVKTFDNKYIIGCNWDEGNGNDDIYLYKINENLEQDTIYPGTYTYDSLCPYQIQSGEIDISDCLIVTDVGEIPTPKEYYASIQTIPIKAYPNPVDGNKVTFEFENTEYLSPPLIPSRWSGTSSVGGTQPHLCIYNVYGKLVHEEMIYPYQGESVVDVGLWKKGMYFGVVYSGGKVAGRCKFVVQ